MAVSIRSKTFNFSNIFNTDEIAQTSNIVIINKTILKYIHETSYHTCFGYAQ